MDTTELEQVSDTCTNKPSSEDMAAQANAIAKDNIENDRQPTNQEMVELSLGLGGQHRTRFFIELFGESSEFEHDMEENKRVVDQNINVLFKWRNTNGQGATVQHIIKAMDQVGNLNPTLREIFGTCRDRTPAIDQPDWGDRVPLDKELNQLCRVIGKNQKALFIWLGLSPQDVEQIEDDNPLNVNNQIFEMFKQWKNQSSNKATINRIIDAMTVVKMDTGAAEAVFFQENDNIR